MQRGRGVKVCLDCLDPGVGKLWPSNCCKTSSIMPIPLGVMLVAVSPAMAHGTCGSATSCRAKVYLVVPTPKNRYCAKCDRGGGRRT